MTLDTRNPFEIILGGIRFRTIGLVQRNMASQWASKVTQGDTDRDSDPHRSTISFSDLRGGIGLDKIEGAGDTDRLWFGTHDTRYEGHLIHLPAAIGSASTYYPNQRTIPIPTIVGQSTAEISFIVDYLNEVYVGFGTNVLKWNDAAGTWSVVLHTLPATATSAFVTRLGAARTLYLLIACGDGGYTYFDNTTWTDVVHTVNWFVWWDARLWSLDNTGQLSFTTAPDETWTADAWLPLLDGSASAFLTSKNSSGSRIILVVSKDGSLWEHNAAEKKFVQTTLDLPVHPDTGIGTRVFRESVYIPSGLALYKFDIQAINAPVSVVGPDRDSGLPTDRSGRIIALLPSRTSLITLVEGDTVSLVQGYLTPGALGGLPPLRYGVTRSKSTILERVGNGWQVLWPGGQDGVVGADRPRINTGYISSAYGQYRLWFGSDTQLWYIDLPQHVINPLQIPNRAYTSYAESITPWFNAGVAEAVKVALNALAETRNLAKDGPIISIDLGCDYVDDVWHHIVTYDGNHLHPPVTIPDCTATDRDRREGQIFQAIRFRFRSTLGPNQTITADLTGFTAEYYKRLGIRQKYQWNLTVDLSEPVGLNTEEDLMEKLTMIVGRPELTPFYYEKNQTEPYYVKVFQEGRGRFTGGQNEKAYSLLTLAEL